MAAVPPVGSGPGCPYGLSPAGRSMVNCFEKTLTRFVSQNHMWFYHAQKALSMIFWKIKKIIAQSTNLNTVAKYYDARYTMVTTVLIVLLILALLEIVLLNGAAAVRIHPPDEFSLVAKQKPQRTCIRWGFLVERSNPNPNHCPLGHLWRRFHRKWWFLCRLCSWM